MRHYELMVILDPSLDERTVAPSLDTFLNVIRTGRRHRREGRHLGQAPAGLRDQRRTPRASTRSSRSTCEPAAVAELDRQLNLNESVLRTKVLRREPKRAAAALRAEAHGWRHRHHRGRQPDRRPRAAVHPVRRRGRQLHRRLHPAHLRPRSPASGRTARRCSCAATSGGRRPRTSPSRSPAACGSSCPAGCKQRSFETTEGEKRTVVELEVDEIGPSLRYATAKVNKVSRGSGGGFGGGGGGRRRRRLRWRRPAPARRSDDPWGSAPPAGSGPAVRRRAALLTDPPASDSPLTRSTEHMAKPVLRKPKKKVCAFCKDKAQPTSTTRTPRLLRKFISDRGKIRARRVTGNCTPAPARHRRSRSRTPARWRCCPTPRPLAEQEDDR